MKKNYDVLVFVLILIVDQITKALVVSNNLYYDLKVFAINYVQNTGISFGLFPGNNMLMIWIYLIVLGVLMTSVDKIKKQEIAYYLMIITGLIGNLIDRIFRGFVVDFIDFKFWPVFNIADMLIVIGVIGLIVMMIRKPTSSSHAS
jgi:signal peptidase II